MGQGDIKRIQNKDNSLKGDILGVRMEVVSLPLKNSSLWDFFLFLNELEFEVEVI